MVSANATKAATIAALLSAALYGASVPLSKVLLEGITSNWLSAFLYLGAGIACGIAIAARNAAGRRGDEASLAKSDLPAVVLMLAVNTASIICLMHGIRLTVAANASLLVNFEIVATAVFAWLLFRENIGRRLGAAIALICVSSVLLTWEGAGSLSFTPGSLLIIAACALWGLENCCTKSLSAKDPLQVTCVKGFGTALAAGVVALVTDGMPSVAPAFLAGSLGVGAVSYGASIALYIAAQRTLGAARTGNYYAVAPFVGVALAAALPDDEPPQPASPNASANAQQVNMVASVLFPMVAILSRNRSQKLVAGLSCGSLWSPFFRCCGRS